MLNLSTNNASSADNQQGRFRPTSENPQRLYVKCSNIEELDQNEVNLIAILYTDGCLSPKGKNSWRLFLGSTSWQIIELFKVSLISLFNLPEERIRITERQVNGKPYFKAAVDSKEIGSYLFEKYGTFRTLKYFSSNGRSHYPKAYLPKSLAKDKKAMRQFLKVAFSCDGGINLYVARNKYVWLIRNVYLACQHPMLIKQYYLLLKKLGIGAKILYKDELLRIQGKENIKKFAKEIGFLDSVQITQNSAYWQGMDKQQLLKLAITSYGDPKSIYDLPQFRVKR